MYEILDTNTGKKYPIDPAKLKRFPGKGEFITLETDNGQILSFEVINYNSIYSANGDGKLVIMVKTPKQ